MGNAGTALMGIGRASGKNRAEDAAAAAISSPLLDFPIEKAKGVVFNVVGGADMTLQEINAAAEVIYDAVDANANIIFGALVDESLTGGEIAITVIATGFPNAESEKKKQADLEKKPENDRTITIAQAKARNEASEKRERESKKQERVDDEDDVPDIISRLRKRR
jgi:cell division protein FtsZ